MALFSKSGIIQALSSLRSTGSNEETLRRFAQQAGVTDVRDRTIYRDSDDMRRALNTVESMPHDADTLKQLKIRFG